MASSTPTTRTHAHTHTRTGWITTSPSSNPTGTQPPTVCPRTAELGIKPAHRHTPAVRPRVPKHGANPEHSLARGKAEDSRTQHQASRRPHPSSKPEAKCARAPVLLILRDIPLRNQTRILALNKHLLTRLNVAFNEGTTPSRIDTHPLRRNI